ncbi:MAG: pyrroline-5-carboxylate reductase [Hyphomicrobiales bacterium]|nr:pyrroline-5-carboxylate reductase [Hyphomicrobiales bacterium]
MYQFRPSLTLVGAGKMGFALLHGWLDRDLAGPETVVLEPAPSGEAKAFCAARGARLNPPGEPVAPRTLVLAIKPQMLDQLAPILEPLAAPDTLVVSILAGKRVADLSARLPRTQAFVRAMPNTPAAIGRGVTGAFATAGVSAEQRACADVLLRAVGGVEWLDDEALIDAVTGVSGSGPAYVFYLAEALAEAGRAAGLPADLSARLARATVEGASALMSQSESVTPGQLRENVTSPGGTTAAALEVLMGKDGLKALMTRAVAAATRRAEELSG